MKEEYEQLIIEDPEILEMNNIFEKISNKYKNKFDEYLLKATLDKKLNNYAGKGKVEETIEDKLFVYFYYPLCYIEKGNKIIDIEFLVKPIFLDEKEKKKFSFWVCSFNYLKEKLQSLGYKQAKINKQILFPVNEFQQDKDSNGSSSESFDLDIKLMNYEVIISKKTFSLENIFDESQKLFDPTINLENIKEYRKDLNMSKTIDKNKDKFQFNKYYITDLRNFIKRKNNLFYYFYNEKSGLTFSLLQLLEINRELMKTRYFYFNSNYIEEYN